MRLNVYDKELTDACEVVTKSVDGVDYVGIRFFTNDTSGDPETNAAVTFWTRDDLRPMLQNGIDALDKHYGPGNESDAAGEE